MNEFIDCSKVYVSDKSKFGYGVFAKVDIKKDDIVEIGLMIRLFNVDGNENPHLFTWSDDRQVWAMGSGCLPFYNHSYNPNVKKIGDLKNDTMIIIALCDIKKDEELLSKYYSVEWRKCFENLK